MGLSVAISGGIIMMTIMLIFGSISVILYQTQVETTATSQAFDNNDEITKTDISISGINYTIGSNLVNFTLTNDGSKKLWNYDDFDIIITYDADILGTRSTQIEQFTYDADAFTLSNSRQEDLPEFNVQHICDTIPDGSLTLTHTVAGLDYTAPTGEAFVRIVNTRLSGNGDTVDGNPPNQQVEDFTAYISDATDLTTQIIFERNDNPGAEDTRICYEIVDFIGLSDSGNAIKVLDQNVVTYTSGLTTVTGASVTPDDDSDVVVFITGQAGEENAATQWTETLSTAQWDGTNDQPIFTRGLGSGTEDDNDLSYAIVEFSGSNWNIQRIEHTYAAAGAIETETAPTDFTAVGSTSRTFLHTQHTSGTDSGLDTQGEEAWLSDVDEISFQLEAGANFAQVVTVVWIIENTQTSGIPINIQHISGTRSGGATEDIFAIPIPTNVRDIAESAIMGENARTTGGGVGYPRGAIALQITADDTVTGYRSDEANTQTYRFSVVEFPQATACAGGNSDNIAIFEWTINCIKFDYFEPNVVNPDESPEILTKLEYPLFTSGLLKISVSTDKGITANQTTTIN